MSGRHTTPDPACDDVRRFVEDGIDHEGSFYEPDGTIEQHLAHCSRCRDHRDDLLALHHALRKLPLLPLPDDALHAVLSRTVGLEAAGRGPRLRRVGWTPFATAAAVVIGMLLPWSMLNGPNAAVRKAKVDRAVVETHYVLDVVAGALYRAERLAVNDVLGGRVAEAVHCVSFDWSNFPLPIVRRSGT